MYYHNHCVHKVQHLEDVVEPVDRDQVEVVDNVVPVHYKVAEDGAHEEKFPVRVERQKYDAAPIVGVCFDLRQTFLGLGLDGYATLGLDPLYVFSVGSFHRESIV